MASNFLIVHLLNPVKFVEIAPSDEGGGFTYTLPFPLGVPGKYYHYKHFDQDWHLLSLLPWQLKVDYHQKWQTTDEIPVQVELPAANSIQLHIYDSKGSSIASPSPLSVVTKAGNYYNGVQLKTVLFRFSWESLTLDTGNYWIVLLASNGESTKTFISEPLSVKQNHPGTVLIEYNHSKDRYNATFSQNPRFKIRVEAEVPIDNWGYIDTSFDGQQAEPSITYSDAIRRFSLNIGTKTMNGYGVAAWVIDRIVQGLRCDFILIDGKQFCRIANNDPELEKHEQYPLWTASFKLLEQDRIQNIAFGASEARYQFPTSYPFMISSLSLESVSIADNTLIGSLADLEDLRDDANTIGLLGFFSLEGTTLVYTNDRSERYFTFNAVILTKRFGFDIDAISSYVWKGFVYNGGTIVVDFGVSGTGGIQTYTDVGVGIAVSKTYGASTPAYPAYTINIWHEDNITSLIFGSPVINGYSVISLDTSSVIPTSLITFRMIGQAMTQLPGSLFDPYDTKVPMLNELSVKQSLLNSFSPAELFTAPMGIKRLDFMGNKLTSADIEDFTTGVANWYTQANGFIALIGQVPSAPPTPTTEANLTLLSTSGWIYTTD